MSTTSSSFAGRHSQPIGQRSWRSRAVRPDSSATLRPLTVRLLALARLGVCRHLSPAVVVIALPVACVHHQSLQTVKHDPIAVSQAPCPDDIG